MNTLEKRATIRGGEFLIKESKAVEIFVPEEFTEEQKMIAQTCRDFLTTEVWPRLDEIDHAKCPELIASLLGKAGELGLLGTSVPDEYGGFGMNFNTSMLVSECTGAGNSFSVALSAHTGIGTLPIMYYGSETQKKKYLPKLASGEWKSAYCLTEPDAGSDANSGKSSAVLAPNGKEYLLNGQKMWITNGGFADVFIVFAKIHKNGQAEKNLSAFIVDKSLSGITMNPPEKKMGIKGSDTRQIFFNDSLVPAENLLSEPGNGFKIAVNILNVGRIKLAAAALGGAKKVLNQSITYANERKQFGQKIASFGAIKHKLAQMTMRTYACESAAYRIGEDIESLVAVAKEEGLSDADAKLKALAEYAVECAVMKVYGSEMLDYVVDEGVQIYGGMGYSADAPMDRAYRDSRINRIFEGTNEINRLLIIDMLIKRTMKGQLDLLGPAKEVAREIMAIPEFDNGQADDAWAAEKKVLSNIKKAFLMVAGAAVQKLGAKLEQEQEIIMNLADMVIQIYIAESILLRVEKLSLREMPENINLKKSLVTLCLYQGVDSLALAGKMAITGFAEGDELRVLLSGLRRFTKIEPVNLIGLARNVAEAQIDANFNIFQPH